MYDVMFSGDYDPEPKYIITPMAAFANRSQLQVFCTWIN